MPEKIPRVSIGMPTYNGAKYLVEALDSLLAQSFSDFELVISDNASTDSTEAICRDFAESDSRIRYVRQTKNLGAAGNFNRVFELARGRYFTWAASDDIRAPTFIEKCVEILDQRPEVLWCHTRSSHIGPDGEILTEAELQNVSYLGGNDLALSGNVSPNILSRAAVEAHQRFEAVLLGPGGCIDSYGLIRAAALRKTRLVLPYFGAEKVLMSELAMAGRYAEVPETLFFMRVHDAAVGSAKTGSDQQATFAPNTRSQLIRFRLLAAYLRVVANAPLTLAERMRCYLVIFRYLLQLKKWPSVLRKAATSAGIGGDNSRVLTPSENITR